MRFTLPSVLVMTAGSAIALNIAVHSPWSYFAYTPVVVISGALLLRAIRSWREPCQAEEPMPEDERHIAVGSLTDTPPSDIQQYVAVVLTKDQEIRIGQNGTRDIALRMIAQTLSGMMQRMTNGR